VNTTGMDSLKESIDQTNHCISQMQDCVSDNKSAIDTLRKDLGRTDNRVRRLYVAVEQLGVPRLRESQKITNVSLDKLGQDLAKTIAIVNSLQGTIEKQLMTDISQLRDELGRTNLKSAKLGMDVEQNKACLLEERDNSRSMHANLEEVRGELQRAGAFADVLDARSANAASTAKDMRQRLDKLHCAVTRLQDDVGNMQNNMVDTRGHVKELGNSMMDVKDNLDRTKAGLATAHGRLDSACGNLDVTRGAVEKIHSHVLNLSEDQDHSRKGICSLMGQLCDLGSTAKDLEDRLHETSSLVLPNLRIESDHTSRKQPAWSYDASGIMSASTRSGSSAA